jgi:hypothetical protein
MRGEWVGAVFRTVIVGTVAAAACVSKDTWRLLRQWRLGCARAAECSAQCAVSGQL